MRTSRRAAEPAEASGRHYDMDWLRVAAILVIFAYHVGRLFDGWSTMGPALGHDMQAWHVKYHELTPWPIYPMAVGAQFTMPLFWVLSGMATWFGLRSHAVGAYMRRRAFRLLVPVVTLGWWVFGPIQVYIEATTGQHYIAPPFEGSFWEFLPHYVSDGVYGFGGYFPWDGLHLWYLTHLFLLTLLSLPLFLWLRTPRGQRASAAAAGFLCRPAAIYLLAVPLAVVETFLPRGVPLLTTEEGGWLLVSYWVFLVLGFFLVSDPRLRATVQRHRWPSLIVAAVTTVPLLVLASGIASFVVGSPGFIGFMVLRSLNGWLWIVAILGFGSAHLNRSRPVLGYIGAAVLPFYILHQPLIVVLGYLTADWGLPIPLMYVLVALTVMAVSLCLYEFAIRRVALLRLLFGMGGAPPTSPTGPTIAAVDAAGR
ncbi:acyltransferase family protein [Tessaracoccus sp. G1721]